MTETETENGNGNGSGPREGDGQTTGAGPLTMTKRDFTSDQEVRWCPGCGDYAILAAVQRVRATGKKVAQAHLVHLNPFPPNLGEVLARYRTVLVPEMNLGQLSVLVRSQYLVDAVSFTKVQGQPIFADELAEAIEKELA